jgi:hypothetical protein
VPVKDTKAPTIANAVFDNILMVYGKPDKIITDRGTEFVNAGIESMLEKWSIPHILSHPRNKSRTTKIERLHGFINSTMTTLAYQYGDQWDTYVRIATFCYNVTTCRSTTFSPFSMIHGQDPCLPWDLLEPLQKQSFKTEEDYHMWRNVRLKKMWSVARDAQLRAAEYNQESRKGKSKPFSFKPGDLVLWYQPPRPGAVVRAKWRDSWSGPHHIVSSQKLGSDAYNVRHCFTGRIFQASSRDLNLFDPWDPAQISTSFEFDKQQPWYCGGKVPIKSLIIVREAFDYWSVGKLLRVEENDTMLFQWYGNALHGQIAWDTFHANEMDYKSKPIFPAWQRPDEHIYFRATPISKKDVPYTSRQTETRLRPVDVYAHSFALTGRSMLPAELSRAMDAAMHDFDEKGEIVLHDTEPGEELVASCRLRDEGIFWRLADLDAKEFMAICSQLAQWPLTTQYHRKAGSGQSLTLGVVFRKTEKRYAVGTATWRRKHLALILRKFADKNVPIPYNAVTVNTDYAAERHTDTTNLRGSLAYTVSFGLFEGGDLLLGPQAVPVTTKYRPILAHLGDLSHSVAQWSGTRHSLTFYIAAPGFLPPHFE